MRQDIPESMRKSDANHSDARGEQSSGRASLWAFLVATFFGIGTLGPGPGTWASAAALLIWAGISRAIGPRWQVGVLAGLATLVIVIGIPAASRVAAAAGKKDPGFIVIDEVAGQWITILFAPLTWKTGLVGFILFRVFDIVKPPPIRSLERLPAGTGIVADDVAAGLYGLLVMQLILHFGLLSR